MSLLQRTYNNTPTSVRDLVWQTASYVSTAQTNIGTQWSLLPPRICDVPISILRPKSAVLIDVSVVLTDVCRRLKGNRYICHQGRSALMKAAGFLKTPVDVHQSTLCHIPEDNNLQWSSVDKNQTFTWSPAIRPFECADVFWIAFLCRRIRAYK